ncbi:MAG: serpin family protein [Cyanobacteriota bacterium]
MKLQNRRILAASLCLTLLSLANLINGRQFASAAASPVAPNLIAQASDPVVNAKLIAANTRLSFKLFSQILKAQPNQNIFISPTSIAMALSMTYNGAKGETQQAMAQTLELQGMSFEELNQANAILKATLTNPDPSVQLSIANSLWARKGESFNPKFLQNNQNFYGAQVTELDFNSPSASDIINNWVKQSTSGNITKIVDGQEITPTTILFLINAIYFKGLWTTQFDKTQTKELPFTLLNGTQKQHPIMFQQAEYQYYANQLFQAVSLPYGEGRLSLYIFLPQKNVSLETFYNSLNAENWEQWMNQFQPKQLLVGIPRFRLDYGLELNDALKSLGMAIAFDENRADFAEMTQHSAYISKVKHNTFFEVNEEGSEAGAAASVQIASRSITPHVVVDRPFFCVIRDNQTQAILFMGSIVEPE